MMAVDVARAEDFGQKMVDVMNHAAIALMTSLGHRTGLFDTMATLPPATSGMIATSAGLSERYVREWLGAMVTGRIVEYDEKAETYFLPREHAMCLTRDAEPTNIAAIAQFFPVLGSVETEIVECFRKGGGVPYDHYERFHEVMAEDSAQTVVSALEKHILPLVPGLAERLEQGIRVLDVGCGSGLALVRLAEMFPRSLFTGFDLCKEAANRASAEGQAKDLENVAFAVCDVSDPSAFGKYDLVTAFDAIHDQARPAVVLANIAGSLRPGGVFLMQDIAGSSYLQNNMDHPIGPLMYTISCLHCMSVSLSQNGDGLGAMWGREKALEMLDRAGFSDVQVHELPHDFQNFFYVCRR
jgi:2-polyprenyl-3-methyl-5-hydroxy-6-metoxy-1,4-benzoquinol methylase